MQIGLHADAVDAHGRSVLERGYSDWSMYADFPPRAYNRETRRSDGPPVNSLASARKWAVSALADPRVDRVEIRESIQEHEGQPWHAGQHVETVTRQEPHAENAGPGARHMPARADCAPAASDAHELAGRLAELTGREVQPVWLVTGELSEADRAAGEIIKRRRARGEDAYWARAGTERPTGDVLHLVDSRHMPEPGPGWNPYDQLFDRLTSAGIPAKLIRFGAHASTDIDPTAVQQALGDGRAGVFFSCGTPSATRHAPAGARAAGKNAEHTATARQPGGPEGTPVTRRSPLPQPPRDADIGR